MKKLILGLFTGWISFSSYATGPYELGPHESWTYLVDVATRDHFNFTCSYVTQIRSGQRYFFKAQFMKGCPEIVYSTTFSPDSGLVRIWGTTYRTYVKPIRY